MALNTKRIGRHRITLEAGITYRASRPFAERGRREYPVTIERLDTGAAVLVIAKLGYEAASNLINAFNNGAMSFDGRSW